MPTVHFTSALKRFFPNLKSMEIQASDVRTLVEKIDASYPGMRSYLLEDNGKLRKHVNIFIEKDLIADEEKLSDSIQVKDNVYIFQALSGG